MKSLLFFLFLFFLPSNRGQQLQQVNVSSVHVSEVETGVPGSIIITSQATFSNANDVPGLGKVRVEYFLGRLEQIDTSNMNDWTVQDTVGVVGGRSNWRVHRSLELSQTRALTTTDPNNPKLGTLALLKSGGGGNWSNIVVQATVRYASQGSTGIAFRVVDPTNYYAFVTNPYCGYSQVLSVESGTAKRIGRGPLNLLLNGHFANGKDIPSSVHYMGCFSNHGEQRLNGHEETPMTYAACYALASDRGSTYFGFEHPEVTPGVVLTGETEEFEYKARCLLSETMNGMQEIQNSKCNGRKSRMG